DLVVHCHHWDRLLGLHSGRASSDVSANSQRKWQHRLNLNKDAKTLSLSQLFRWYEFEPSPVKYREGMRHIIRTMLNYAEIPQCKCMRSDLPGAKSVSVNGGELPTIEEEKKQSITEDEKSTQFAQEQAALAAGAIAGLGQLGQRQSQ